MCNDQDPIPDGWAVYYDGELVFSADDWQSAVTAISKIMEGDND